MKKYFVHAQSSINIINHMRRKNRRLAELLNQSDTLYVTLDAEGRVTAIHPRLVAETGRGLQDLLRQSFGDVFPRFKGTAVEAACERVMAGLKQANGHADLEANTISPVTFEWREPSYAGRMGKWFFIRVMPLSDGLAIFFTDITVQKENNLALIDQAHLIDQINQIVPTILYFYDLRMRSVSFLNTEVLKGLGYTQEVFQAIHGDHPENIFHPEDLPRFREYLENLQASKENKKFSIEVRIRRPEGGYRWFMTHHMVYQRDSAGQVLQILGSALDITDMKRAVQALADSEELYRLAARDAIWDWDLQTNQVRWSGSISEYYGYPEALAGTDLTWWTSHIHPEERDEMFESIYAAIDSGSDGWVSEYRFLCGDGTYANVLDRAYILRGTNNNLRAVRMVGSMQDITRLKRREATDRFLIELGDALASVTSEAETARLTATRVGEFFNASRCLLVEHDTQIENIQIFPDYHPNRESAAGVFGLEMVPSAFRDEIIKPTEQFMVEDTRMDPRAALEYTSAYEPFGLRSYVQTPTVFESGWRGSMLVVSDQPRRWSSDELRLMRSVANLFWLTLDKVRLLENLRQSEEALRVSASRFQMALKRSGLSTFEQDLDLHFTYLHNPMPEFARLDPIGKTDLEILPPDLARQTTAIKQRVLQTGEPAHEEIEARIGERTLYLDMFLEPVRGEQGQVTGILGSVLDITERHKAEADIHEYARKLERSNQDLQDFAYIASHDLQEPLRKVHGFGERLLHSQKDALNDEGQDYLNRMVSAADRMRQMIEDLLDYSRVATKAQEFSPVDLNEIAQEALTDLDARLESTGGQVKVGPLPVIDADPLQMQQLFMNLIGNALKFSRPGVPPVVQVQSRPVEPDQVELVFEDNGIGFENQYLERIFQPFQRLHGRSEYEGSGIGLAICRRIVERHHGKITASSEIGKGSQFVIKLPV